MVSIAIHQPNFIPWMPYFEKMAQVDKFVFLCNCQFEKRGYQNRFNLNNEWYTMSVYQNSCNNIIDQYYINAKADFRKIKHKLPQYAKILNKLGERLEWPPNNLAVINKNIIAQIAEMLGISREFYDDYPTGKKGTDRIIDICKRYEADVYLSGIGGKDYIDEGAFAKAGIKLKYQEIKDRRHSLEVLSATI